MLYPIYPHASCQHIHCLLLNEGKSQKKILKKNLKKISKTSLQEELIFIYLYTKGFNGCLKLTTPNLDEEPLMVKPPHHLIEET